MEPEYITCPQCGFKPRITNNVFESPVYVVDAPCPQCGYLEPVAKKKRK